MRIIVCVKQVPQSSLNCIDDHTYTIRRNEIPLIMNPADEHALEAALNLKDKFGASVCVLTMGMESARDMLRMAASLGTDKLFIVSDPAIAGSDTFVTSRVLSRAIEKIGDADLIICGRRSFDGETGQTAPQIAVNLKRNCVTNVIDIQAQAWNMLTLTRIADEGKQLLEADLPVVLTVCEGINHVRLPSISGMRRAKEVAIQHFTAAELGFSSDEVGIIGSPTRVIKVNRAQYEKRKRHIIKDAQIGVRLIVEHIQAAYGKEDVLL